MNVLQCALPVPQTEGSSAQSAAAGRRASIGPGEQLQPRVSSLGMLLDAVCQGPPGPRGPRVQRSQGEGDCYSWERGLPILLVGATEVH